MGDLRDALPNRGLSISELDLRLAHRKEEERLAADSLKRRCSFNDFFGVKNVVKSLSAENAQTSVKVPSSPLLRLRGFFKSLDFSDSISSESELSLSGNSLNQRKLRASLPSICITHAQSTGDAEHSPRLSRKLGPTLGDAEALGGNECLNINVNKLDEEKGMKAETDTKRKKQLEGEEDKEGNVYQSRVHLVPQLVLRQQV